MSISPILGDTRHRHIKRLSPCSSFLCNHAHLPPEARKSRCRPFTDVDRLLSPVVTEACKSRYRPFTDVDRLLRPAVPGLHGPPDGV
ncbi:hypothetical protein BKA93DRAFT_790408, partial [Sparassis latifolia]